MLKIFFFLISYFFLLNTSVYGEIVNNKFGIHLAQAEEADLIDAAKLVNANGGDWGYITLVIQENDRDLEKWQAILNQLRKLHLIPIIRLATKPEADQWRRPTKDDADGWVKFLDSLNWVVKERYIILFNEPNHGKEWGGQVDPEDYAVVAKAFAQKLKGKTEDFFVMLAGFDAAAPSQPPRYEDEMVFLKKLFYFQPSTFNYIDGWVSHSYPNPGFSGSPYDWGRNSVRNYQWELQLLKELGAFNNFPVVISETGWKNNAPANYIEIAFQNVWLPDNRIFAVTPFLLNYQSEPFSQFSWALPGRGDFYPHYYAVQTMSKVKGEPLQKQKIKVLTQVPRELTEASVYDFKIKIENLGQAIWDKKDGYQISVVGGEKLPLEYFFSDLHDIEPFDTQIVDFHVKTRDKKGPYQLKIALLKDKTPMVDLFSWEPQILPLPSLQLTVALFPKVATDDNDFQIQIFDQDERLVYTKTNVKVDRGEGMVKQINNITLDEKYRVVILKPYYLPRQSHITFKRDENKISFEKMLPLDFSRDGKFSFHDLGALIKDLSLLRLWWVSSFK